MQITFEHDGQPVILEGFENDHISRVIQKTHNFYEASVLEYVKAQQPEGTLIDVGANIGNHTVFFGLFTPAERVIAIEPYAPAAKLLERNVTANDIGDKVLQLTCAASAISGTLGIKPGRSRNRGNTRVIQGDEVNARALDEIAEDCQDISLVKIDVEGYELEVLIGAIQLIERQRPTLIVETSSRRRKKRLAIYWLVLVIDPQEFLLEQRHSHLQRVESIKIMYKR